MQNVREYMLVLALCLVPFLQAGYPSCRSANSVKALKAEALVKLDWLLVIFSRLQSIAALREFGGL